MCKYIVVLFFIQIILSFAALGDSYKSGTGFSIADGNLVITNYHVIRGCTSVALRDVGPGNVEFYDPESDVAIIEASVPLNNSLRLRTHPSIRLGEEVIVVGFPLSGYLSSAPKVTTGIVSSLAGLRDDASRLQISAPIQPGNSGGPVLDDAGNVIGIVVSKLDALKMAPLTGSIPEDVNFAIKSSVAARFLDAHSIKYHAGTSNRKQSVADIVAQTLSAVVEIECVVRVTEPAPAIVPALHEPSARTWSGSAPPYGAIAWDAQSGKRGWSWNQPTMQEAWDVALSECGANGCKVVIRTSAGACAALATTADGKFAGGAARKTKDEARLAAMTNCQKGKAGDCVVRVSDCNNK